MINKLIRENFSDLSVQRSRKVLQRYGFYNIERSRSESTLNLFEATKDGCNFFVKLAPFGMLSEENLNLQGQILDYLYPKLGSFMISDKGIRFLATPELENHPGLTFLEINQILSETFSALKSANFGLLVSNNIWQLLGFAQVANLHLSEVNLINDEISEAIDGQIKILKSFLLHSEPWLNHGDLSNANIMSSKGRVILNDWEDVMVGFNGYDQIYWLSFLGNAHEITLENLNRIPVPLEITHATFFIIVLLKEYLSHGSANRINQVSSQVRLESLFRLPKFGKC